MCGPGGLEWPARSCRLLTCSCCAPCRTDLDPAKDGKGGDDHGFAVTVHASPKVCVVCGQAVRQACKGDLQTSSCRVPVTGRWTLRFLLGAVASSVYLTVSRQAQSMQVQTSVDSLRHLRRGRGAGMGCIELSNK